MPLGLFRLRNVATANVVGILWAAAMFAWFFISALYLQLVLGYSPLQVGLAFLPANLIMGAFSIGLSAKLVMRFGFRIPLSAGLLVAAAGLLVFARAPVNGSFVIHVLPSMILLARVGRRQHVVHDGRSARPLDPREPRSLPNRQFARFRTRCTRRTEWRLPRGVSRRCRLRSRCCRRRRRVPANEGARAGRSACRCGGTLLAERGG